MTTQGVSKFTWVIKDFSSLTSKTGRYHTFEIDNSVCICRISTAPNDNNKPDILSLRMLLTFEPPLRPERRRFVRYRLTVVNHVSEKLSQTEEGPQWFDSQPMEWGAVNMFTLHDKDNGFLVNDELKILAEIDVSEFVYKLDIPEKLDKTSIPQSKMEENSGTVSSVLLKEAETINESIDVNGFQVLPSQVESVRSIFERHPDIAVEFCSKNQHLRKACMNSLLCLIETLCQSLEELSSDDLEQADITLLYLKASKFNLDWLEKKLDQVREKKEKEMSCLAILQETEESLLNLKQKCSELKAELEETKTPMSFDDVV